MDTNTNIDIQEKFKDLITHIMNYGYKPIKLESDILELTKVRASKLLDASMNQKTLKNCTIGIALKYLEYRPFKYVDKTIKYEDVTTDILGTLEASHLIEFINPTPYGRSVQMLIYVKDPTTNSYAQSYPKSVEIPNLYIGLKEAITNLESVLDEYKFTLIADIWTQQIK